MDWKIKYFTPAEFDSPDEPGSGKKMDSGFMITLDMLREKLGRALIINSGYRTLQHNRAIGGVPNSAHTRGLAADISCLDSAFRYQIITEALKLGITRFEIAPAHIHLDADPSLPQNVVVHLAKY